MNTPIISKDIENLLKPYNTTNKLVMVNVRSMNKVADKFDDIFLLTYNGQIIISGVCTCDAGFENLVKPVNNAGTAIVMNGFYEDLWTLGLHKGKYEALKQTGPIVVFRDSNKDNILDYPDIQFDDVFLDQLVKNNNDITFEHVLNDDLHKIQFEDEDKDKDMGFESKTYRAQRGYFGINFHRASAWRELTKVGLYSAGCCVVQNPNVFDNTITAIKDFMESYNLKTVSALYTCEQELINYNK